MDDKEIRKSLIQISLELTTDMEPKWQFVASKLYIQNLYAFLFWRNSNRMLS